MAILRSIEYKIEALLEGIFGRAFRTNVQPVELARKLAKEMDDGRTISVSRVYVSNEYTVYLSPDDRNQFQTYEASLDDTVKAAASYEKILDIEPSNFDAIDALIEVHRRTNNFEALVAAVVRKSEMVEDVEDRKRLLLYAASIREGVMEDPEGAIALYQQVLTIDDLVKGDDVFFSLTGVTDGELVKGVRFFPDGARTETLAMRSRSGTIRRISSVHNFRKLMSYSGLKYEHQV